MNIKQTNKFARVFKRLHDAEKTAVEDAINEIIANPETGEMKKGDLAGVRVHKFRHNDQLKLLAYTRVDETLTLLAYGSHENFYKDLKA